MLGIAEMFNELDGYDRYEVEIESWAARKAEHIRARTASTKRITLSIDELKRRRRERARVYMNNRYQTDPTFRARHLAAAKARYHKPRANAAQHGTVSKYNTGCRCDGCREAIVQYKRDWRMQKEAA